MESYNLSASIYDQLYGEEQTAKHIEGLKMIPPVNGSIILDAGCGSGLLFEKLNGLIDLAVGIDFSERMIKIARSRIKVEGIEFIIGDVENMPFNNDAFDTVFMFTVLNNTPKPLQALNEAWRVLKEKGCLVVSFLKKTFTEEEAQTLLNASRFETVNHSSEETNDYIYICLKKSFYSTPQ
ncbi:class I SAM-dependent methyltransferase [Candidatus Bathyarchaeota archaeon]|nr:class I SAM-dependent methyltransferase [Candidatus Bathyarchaeota archaeon]